MVSGLTGTLQGTLGGIGNKVQAWIDSIFPPEKRNELFAKIAKFANERPMLAVRNPELGSISTPFKSHMLTTPTVLHSLPYRSYRFPSRPLHCYDHQRRHLRHPSRPHNRPRRRRPLHRNLRWLCPHHPPSHALYDNSNRNIHLVVGHGNILHPEEVQSERYTWYPYTLQGGHE